MEEKHKTEFLKKLASTRSHGRRRRMPSANQQRRGCMTDATAWQEKLRMTRPRDRGHTPKIAENAPCDFWSPFWPKSKSRRHRLEIIKCGNASIQGGPGILVTFHDLGLVGERFSPLSLGLGFRFRILFAFRIISLPGSIFLFITFSILFMNSSMLQITL